jgi:CMP-N,N'-diacetyllegionaminic acid synthase
MGDKVIGIIPARSGSLRVPNKSLIKVNDHPIIAYSIIEALESKLFSSVMVASNSDEVCKIGKYYGADKIVMRNDSDCTSTSLDIDWLKNLDQMGLIDTEYFAILRPTSPLRSRKLMENCFDHFFESGADSLRTITKVKEHPGKMWELNLNSIITPYIRQNKSEVATHAKQYQSLPEIYIQTSVMEIAQTRVIKETESREGKKIVGYLTQGIDNHAIDTPEDLNYLKFLVNENPRILPNISISEYQSR